MELVINVLVLAILGAFACLADDFLTRLFSVIAVMTWSFGIGTNFMDWENGEDDDNE